MAGGRLAPVVGSGPGAGLGAASVDSHPFRPTQLLVEDIDRDGDADLIAGGWRNIPPTDGTTLALLLKANGKIALQASGSPHLQLPSLFSSFTVGFADRQRGPHIALRSLIAAGWGGSNKKFQAMPTNAGSCRRTLARAGERMQATNACG